MTFEEQLKAEKNPAIIKIGNYLKKRAVENPNVESTIKKKNKNLKECWSYVLGEISSDIYREGNLGIAAGDDQILFDLALHYYDEDNIEIKKTNWDKVVSIDGNQEELEKIVNKTKKKVMRKKKKVVKTDEIEEQMSLFEV